ncbi:NUDIX hydrolase domain-like protein [Dipodascopsis tothii]|uniref:NUDIX hydrolase domain-like protein n=1 Tax=Dipodascopsis tothii TaxID=44089 RepID=UPI0034CF3E1C
MSVSAAKVYKFGDLTSSEARWVKVQKAYYYDPTGKERDWEFAARRTRPEGCEIDGVAVIAIIERESGPEILLQKQFRAPVNGVVIELPAGLIDPNETPEECAERELLEETGYYGKAYTTGPVMFCDPGFCNTNMKLVQVTIDMTDPRNAKPEQHLEEEEFIENFTVPLREFPDTLKKFASEGYIMDARVHNIAAGIEVAKKFQL